MLDIDKLRSRYTALNGMRPASSAFLTNIETTLGVLLPLDFQQISEFSNGSGFNVLSLYSLAGDAPSHNPLTKTLEFRTSIGLPSNWLVLGEPPESLLVMDSSSGKVLWLDSIDAPRLASLNFSRQPDSWNSFSDFFEYLLDEEEEDRE